MPGVSVGIAPADAVTAQAHHHLFDASLVQRRRGKAGLVNGLDLEATQHSRFALIDLEQVHARQPGAQLFALDDRHGIHEHRLGG